MYPARFFGVCYVSYIVKMCAGFQFIPNISRYTCRTFAMLTTQLVVPAFIWKLLNHWKFGLCISGSSLDNLISECSIAIKNYEQQQ